jgi:WD40 repeat protein
VGSADGAVLIWNVATRQMVGNPLITGDASVWSTAFSLDGAILAVGTGSGTTQLWNVSYLANVLGRLCSQVGGSVTRAEWTQYVPPGIPYRGICPQPGASNQHWQESSPRRLR